MTTPIQLSTLDYVYAGDAFDPISLVFQFDGFVDVERVTNAFHETVPLFPGIGAVLAEVDERTCVFDTSRSAAQIDVDRAQRRGPLTAHNDAVSTTPGAPLARARITQLRDGGSLIALSLAHVVADGYGFFLFMSAWAAKARQQPFPSVSADRTILRRTVPESPSAAPSTTDLAGLGLFVAGAEHADVKLEWHEAPLVVPVVNDAEGRPLSRNDVLCSTLWRESLSWTSDSVTTLCCLADLRRYVPQLGPLFFGNAALVVPITVETAQLARASVPEISGWIRRGLEKIPTRIEAALAEVEGLRLTQGLTAFKRLRSARRSGILISNIERAPLQTLDFAAGPPTSVEAVVERPGSGPAAVVLPGTDGPRLILGRP